MTKPKSRKIQRRSVLGIAAVGLISLSGLAVSGMPVQAGALEEIVARGKVRVGVPNINPYGYVDADGNVTGESPELAKLFFASLGVTDVEPVVTEWGSLIGGLLAGRFDVISTGMLIQPKRCEQVAFGNPEYKIGRAFGVKAGNPLNLRSFKDVAEHETARLGLLTGAGEIRYAEIAGVPEDRRILFPDLTAAIGGLRAGRVDAIVASTVTIRTALSKVADTSVEYADLTEQPVDETGKEIVGYGGMAFRKDDTELRAAWNTWLAEAQVSGELRATIEPFGFGPETEPDRGLTAETVCAEAG